jgi:hypothetical protein
MIFLYDDLHRNNARYLRLMNFTRRDHLTRVGVWDACHAHGVNLIVTAQSIRYRVGLHLFTAFHVKSKIIHFDAKALYLEQQFITPHVKGNDGRDYIVNAVATVRYQVVGPSRGWGGPEKLLSMIVSRDNLPVDVAALRQQLPPPQLSLEMWISSLDRSSDEMKVSGGKRD